jgi:ADP-ribose pyrophosphatase
MDFKRISEKLVHDGPFITVHLEEYEYADGTRVDREVARRPEVSVILAINADDEAYFVRQPRPVVGETELLELPAGRIDPGEDPLTAAARELREETGFEAAKLEPLKSFYSSPGFTDEIIHVFLATELRQVGQDLDEEERIEIVTVPVSELPAVVAESQDAKTLISLLLYMQN